MKGSVEAAVIEIRNDQDDGFPGPPVLSDVVTGRGCVVWFHWSAENHGGGGCCSVVLAAKEIFVT